MKDIMNHPVLKNFRRISDIPRRSGQEKAVSDMIAARAGELGLEAEQDEIWNLIIRKPASAGYEDHPPVLLQAHIDMVCEKNRDSSHDFEKDPIPLKIEGDWLMSAAGTSLGADNGIGVAAAMAILESRELEHPPLEVVFTVQEETTFAGAEKVDVSGLRSRRMINLDHADEHELIVGSCGGTGVEFTMPISRRKEIPSDCGRACRLRLTGLMGGHSGEDIHRGRGNAITLLLRVLEELKLPVISIDGGSNRLAIPREAEAVVLSEDPEALEMAVRTMRDVFRKEYSIAAPDLDIRIEEVDRSGIGAAKTGLPLTEESFSRIAAVVRLYPNGIAGMNGGFDGLVESSDNIGILRTEEEELKLVSEIRGAYLSTVKDIQKTVDLVAAVFGGRAKYFNGYVPWEFEADSELRRTAVETYRELFGEDMRQLALHAGLECGFFAEKIPGLDLISIGPDCQSFHSPEERVSLSSTKRFYTFLTALLRRL